MDILICVNKTGTHESFTYKSLTNLANSDPKYQFKELTTVFELNAYPKLVFVNITGPKSYLLFNDQNLNSYGLYQLVVIIEQMPTSDRDQAVLDKIIKNPKYKVFYNVEEDLNKRHDFYSEEFFKKVIDELDTTGLIPYLTNIHTG